MRCSPKLSCLFVIASLCLATPALTWADAVPKAAPPTGQKISLRLNFPKGAQKQANMEMDMKMNVVANDQTIEMKMGMGMGMNFNVQNVTADGVHTMKLTYGRMKMSMKGGPVAIEYDSDDKEKKDDPIGKIFGALVGQQLVLKLDSRGKMLELSGMEEMAKKLGQAIPGGEAQIKKQLKDTENQLGQMVATLPEKPIDNGDTWTATMKQGGQVPMTINATYTLLDRKNGEAIIGVDGKIDGTLSGTMTGVMKIDLKTGWSNSADLLMKAKGKVQGQVDMDMDAKITVGSK